MSCLHSRLSAVQCSMLTQLFAVIWDALKAACESDLATAKVIVESAGIIVAAEDMSVCYDERGECPTLHTAASFQGT